MVSVSTKKIVGVMYPDHDLFDRFFSFNWIFYLDSIVVSVSGESNVLDWNFFLVLWKMYLDHDIFDWFLLLLTCLFGIMTNIENI